MFSIILKFFTSLKLTIVCLGLAMILIFIGTLAQIDYGIHAAQEKYFQSLFIYWSPPQSSWKIPFFPGGHLIGAILLVNLIAAHLYRFRLSWKKSGIFLIHIGIFLLLIGGLLTDLLCIESQMQLNEGETKNYSESLQKTELVIVDTSNSDYDEVISIPDHLLAKNKTIQHPKLPFRLNILRFYPNSQLMRRTHSDEKFPPPATRGLGANLLITEAPPVTKPNEADVVSVIIEILPIEGSLGTWLCSNVLNESQEVTYQNKIYKLELRPTRYYKPYSLKLLDFTHEKYAGTEIPKNFASKLHLLHAENNENREVLIYMNNPLRYGGETYYQASFANNDTTSILQVMRNPSWITPYIACSLVAIGLLVQFSIHLFGFAARKQA